MRALLLNLGTAGATLLLLGMLTFPASRVLRSSLGTGTEKAAAAAAPASQLPEPRRLRR